MRLRKAWLMVIGVLVLCSYQPTRGQDADPREGQKAEGRLRKSESGQEKPGQESASPREEDSPKRFTASQLEREKNRVQCRALVGVHQLSVHWKACGTDASMEPLVRKMIEDLQESDYDARGFHVFGKKNAEEPKDDFEKALLSRFPSTAGRDDDGRSPFIDRISPDDRSYEYYQPVYAKELCVSCHQAMADCPPPEPADSQPKRADRLEEGDLMGVVQIRLPRE